jgi:hypothetical protein
VGHSPACPWQKQAFEKIEPDLWHKPRPCTIIRRQIQRWNRHHTIHFHSMCVYSFSEYFLFCFIQLQKISMKKITWFVIYLTKVNYASCNYTSYKSTWTLPLHAFFVSFFIKIIVYFLPHLLFLILYENSPREMNVASQHVILYKFFPFSIHVNALWYYNSTLALSCK